MARWKPKPKGKQPTNFARFVELAMELEAAEDEDGNAIFVQVQRKRVTSPPRQLLEKAEAYLSANSITEVEAWIDEDDSGTYALVFSLAAA